MNKPILYLILMVFAFFQACAEDEGVGSSESYPEIDSFENEIEATLNGNDTHSGQPGDLTQRNQKIENPEHGIVIPGGPKVPISGTLPLVGVKQSESILDILEETKKMVLQKKGNEKPKDFQWEVEADTLAASVSVNNTVTLAPILRNERSSNDPRFSSKNSTTENQVQFPGTYGTNQWSGLSASLATNIHKAKVTEPVVVTNVDDKKNKKQVQAMNGPWVQQKTEGNAQIRLRALHKTEQYAPNRQHTVLVEALNLGDKLEIVQTMLSLPQDWQLISISNLGNMEKNEKKMVLISFFVPSNVPAGRVASQLMLLGKNKKLLKSENLYFDIGSNFDIDVFNVKAPQSIEAGKTIHTTYAIKNNGNVSQEVVLHSKNTIEGPTTLTIAPDSIAIVDLIQETDSKIYALRVMGTNLEVSSQTSGKKHVAFKSVEVFPVKIKRRDPFFRLPLSASVLYNGYTAKNDHFSTMSFEFAGNGYLDVNREHYVNFLIRGPRQENLKRFGVADQYSMVYRHKQRTTLHIGDHGFYTNRLGIHGKFGMGFRLDQRVRDWTLSAFYTKPRLYDFNDEAVYGVQAKYHLSDSLTTGVSLVRTRRSDPLANQKADYERDEIGQILTLDLEYKNKNTVFLAESSLSATNRNVDFANYFNFRKSTGNLSYTGSLTLTGKDYFGTITNSVQFNNALHYSHRTWNFGIGQNLSKVNQRLNPLFYAAEPYFENYYATMGLRFSKKHQAHMRLDKRIREDRLEQKNYHYREHGLNYGYNFNDKLFSANFYGRMGRTRNLLSDDIDYRNTYSHNLNLAYQFAENIGLRGGINHNYSNRYGSGGTHMNYVRYSLGFSMALSKNVRFNGSFNSGFSPEDTYMKRDYVNFNFFARIKKNHLLELRANYFENPGVIDQKEILAFAKYTYSFGAPLKKIINEGGLVGQVVAENESVNIKGVKIVAAGKTVMTDREGNFEINNLPMGRNYILVDQSSLGDDVITSSKIPYEVEILEKNKARLIIRLVKSGSIKGNIQMVPVSKNVPNPKLHGFVKLHNRDFVYYTESNERGEFNFHQVVPGTYDLVLLKLKDNDSMFQPDRSAQITLAEGGNVTAVIDLKVKKRQIRFKETSVKVEAYENK